MSLDNCMALARIAELWFRAAAHSMKYGEASRAATAAAHGLFDLECALYPFALLKDSDA